MARQGAVTITMNMDERILAKVDEYRYAKRYSSRTEAIERLLDWAVDQNPARTDKDAPRPRKKQQRRVP